MAVPSTKACHTHGSAGVGRGGCFAGTSPEIIPDISPPSRCRRFGMPENQKIRKPQRLRDSRSSEGFMNFAAQGASVTSGDFTASGVHTDSDAAGNLMGLPLGGLPGACGFRGFLNFRRLSSLRRPHGIRGYRRLRGLGRSRWLRCFRGLHGPTSRGSSRNLWLPRQSMLSRTQALPRQPMPSLPRASPRTQRQPEPW